MRRQRNGLCIIKITPLYLSYSARVQSDHPTVELSSLLLLVNYHIYIFKGSCMFKLESVGKTRMYNCMFVSSFIGGIEQTSTPA